VNSETISRGRSQGMRRSNRANGNIITITTARGAGGTLIAIKKQGRFMF